jgi:hypothetical protein
LFPFEQTHFGGGGVQFKTKKKRNHDKLHSEDDFIPQILDFVDDANAVFFCLILYCTVFLSYLALVVLPSPQIAVIFDLSQMLV